MRLINSVASNLNAAFIGEQYCEEEDVSFRVDINFLTDGGLNYWFFKGPKTIIPPIEFQFDDSGLLSSVSVFLRKVSVVHRLPSFDSTLPPFEEGVPKVSLKTWNEHNSSIIEERLLVHAWLSSDYLWVMGEGSRPKSCFDTKGGIFVLFDENRAFSGVAIKFSCDRHYLKKILGAVQP